LVFKKIDITVEVKGKTISLNVKPEDKVSTIKDQVKEKEGVDASTYSLKLGGQARQGDRTIWASQIHAGSALRVDYGLITIDIKGPRQTYHLEVDPDDKVQVITNNLKNNQGLKGEFSLKVGDRVISNSETIAQAGIKKGTLVVVDMKEITIHYKFLGKTEDISVDPDNEINAIKTAIKEKEGITTDKFVLMMNNKVLDTTNSIVSAVIRAGTTITVGFD
jgi:hypothetical protein